MNKVYLDENKELWYIDDFLLPNELEWLMSRANETTGWYKTMRSASIRNKFFTLDIPLHPAGAVSPHSGLDIGGDIISIPEPGVDYPRIKDEDIKFRPIYLRLVEALPPTLASSDALQSFWPLAGNDNGGGAYDWHFEKGHEGINDSGMTAAWSLYLNDNFEGGILEFKYKPYKIAVKPGRLVNIPMTEEWTHRVTPVTEGVRHTLYGTCFEDITDRAFSTSETC